ncbi:MAG: hypothetical protein ACOCX2_07950, partial [Armatimonadota bacterium]
WLLSPWGATVIVMVAWLIVAVPRTSSGTMGGPDMPVIIEHLQEDHSLRAVLSWFTGPWVQGPEYYRPIISLLHWMDFRLWGESAWGWRLTNTLIIALTFPALTWLCDRGLRNAWAGPAAAVALASIPPTAEMAKWPAWRTDAVCGIFLLLASGAAFAYLREGARGRLWLALGMLLLALMSKETAIIWPAFAAVSVLLIARDTRGLTLVASATALTGAFWLVRVSLLGHPLLGELSMTVNFDTATELRFLLQTALDPLYADFTRVYPAVIGEEAWWLVPTFWQAVVGDAVFVAANIIVGVTNLRLLGVLWAWRIITYLPSMPFGRMWDFYYYIPTLGTALLYAVAAADLARMVRPHIQPGRGKCAIKDETEAN